MKTLRSIFLSTVLLFGMSAAACSSPERPDPSGGSSNIEQMKPATILITAGGRTFTASLADNSSAAALADLLAKGDVTIAMNDYAGMEKVGPLPVTLPRNDRQIDTSAGDLILYMGNQFVIYYGSNSWSLTRLGRITDATAQELRSALGSGSVTVTLSLNR